MEPIELAKLVVNKMYNQDFFSQWLGIKIISVSPGSCVLTMKIRTEMLNGFGIAHGGIAFSLADSALAFASNSYGRRSVSVDTSISHTIPLKEDDEVTATAEEISLTNKLGIYNIRMTRQDGSTVAYFKGTVYRTSKDWFPELTTGI